MPIIPDKTAERARRAAAQALQSKTFAELTPEEKEQLLKVAAIKLGLIKED
jgi:hypothetical protein